MLGRLLPGATNNDEGVEFGEEEESEGSEVIEPEWRRKQRRDK